MATDAHPLAPVATITEPGVYDIPDAEYHRDPVEGGSLSSTGARRLLAPSCPAKFRWYQQHPEIKTEYDFGHAAHRAVLGIGAEIAVFGYDSWRTKAAKADKEAARAAGLVPMLEPDAEIVAAMADVLRAHEVAGRLFQPGRGVAEQTLVWRDRATGIMRRARLTAIIFMDTETTGLSLDDDIWEFAAIRRETDGTETEHHLFILHDQRKCEKLPEPFHADHRNRWSRAHPVTRAVAAKQIHDLTADRPHIVGAVPNFDTERLALLLRAHGYEPGWHYHLIDVENLAVGYLAARRPGMALIGEGYPDLSLPWDSDSLSLACGVKPPTDERHTAMGDARWAKALYDAIVGAA